MILEFGKKMLIKIFLGITITLFYSACGSSESKKNIDTIKLKTSSSSLSRTVKQNVDANSTNALVQGLNTFAFDLYSELKKGNEGENLFFSPLSISTALAIVYPGAVGETKSEMVTTLHFSMEDAELLDTFNALDASLNKENDNYIFKGINALWPDETLEFKSTYLDAIMQNFGAVLYPLDFINNPEQSRLTINEWVEEQTNDKIVELLKEGDIKDTTRLVLTNAVYFNGKWQYEFDEEDTKIEPFYLLNNSSINIQMMNQTTHINYAESNNCKMVELPYKDSNASMLIVLPNEGFWDDFINDFNFTVYSSLVEQMYVEKVELKLPKFKVETPQYSLKTSLKELGMAEAFEDTADFSKITNDSIKIGDVLHKAYISVDEKETEAAAATAVVTVSTVALPIEEEIKIFHVDQPFIIFLQDKTSDQILFMGEILNPSI